MVVAVPVVPVVVVVLVVVVVVVVVGIVLEKCWRAHTNIHAVYPVMSVSVLAAGRECSKGGQGGRQRRCI